MRPQLIVMVQVLDQDGWRVAQQTRVARGGLWDADALAETVSTVRLAAEEVCSQLCSEHEQAAWLEGKRLEVIPDA